MMLKLESRYGSCYIDMNKIVAIEAYEIWCKNYPVDGPGVFLEFGGTRIIFEGGGEVIVNGNTDDVVYLIEQRRNDEPTT